MYFFIRGRNQISKNNSAQKVGLKKKPFKLQQNDEKIKKLVLITSILFFPFLAPSLISCQSHTNLIIHIIPMGAVWEALLRACVSGRAIIIVISIYIMFSLNELMQAFDNNLLFAWEVLHADILLESATLSADHLRRLVLLYSKGLEKCAHLQDSQNNYFKHKIDQLMGQRKVIQCLHDENAEKRRKDLSAAENSRQERTGREDIDRGSKQEGGARAKAAPIKLNPSLQARKRQIEMRLAYDIEESRTSKVSKMLKEQSLREQKLQGMMLKCISSEQEKLKHKIQQRKQRASLSGRMAASLKLDTSVISTCSYGMDSYDNLDTILDEIPFISSDDPDL